MLDKARLGLLGMDGGGSKPEDPNSNRIAEVVIIERLMATVYPEGGHAKLTRDQCREALLERTFRGAAVYEEFAASWAVDAGDVRAVVRRGRRFLTVELAARSLIPVPQPRGIVSAEYLDVVESIERRAAELARVRDDLQRASAERARAPSQGARGLVANG